MGSISAPGFVETCTDPATRCLRRAPASLSAATELAVSCGANVVSFPLNASLRAWLTNGIAADWVAATGIVQAGFVANIPNTLWTGSASESGFIAARGQGSGGTPSRASILATPRSTIARAPSTPAAWCGCSTGDQLTLPTMLLIEVKVQVPPTPKFTVPTTHMSLVTFIERVRVVTSEPPQ